jgi:23S rRNA maturation-related 3'-5' exoribonuclease YhaM
MITDQDLKKINSLLTAMEKRQDEKINEKLTSMEKRQDEKINAKLTAMEKRLAEKIVKDVSDMVQSSVIKSLNEHEYRLDRLEKTVGGFPPVGS